VAAVTRTIDDIERDLNRERVILGHVLHSYDIAGMTDTWRRIDELLDERLTVAPQP
jgi:hypothetical protein